MNLITECPEEEIEQTMSNFDGSIDEGMAEALKSRPCYGRHAAWEYNARVWWNGEKFVSQIWRYGCVIANESADTLEELMEIHCSEYGRL